MNTIKLGLRIGYALSIAASSLLFTKIPAQAINLSLEPSNFTVDKGVGTNSASSTSTLNNASFGNGTNGGGFEEHFSNDFLLLGASTNSPYNDTDIRSDSLHDDNSRAISNTFSLDSTDITKATTIDFKWAFNGNSTGGAGDQDNFQIYMNRINPSNPNQIFSSTLAFSKNRSSDLYARNSLETVTIPANTFASGSYNLRINVNENDDPNAYSSAAGFSNFQVQTVPFEFSPSQGLLLVGGIWGLSSFLKRRKDLANCSKSLLK
jgi:hypothetical protein